MSYRDDLNEFSAQRAKRRGIILAIIKITVVALAVAFLAATVMLIVDIAGGGSSFDSSSGGSSGGSSSGGGKDSKAPVIALAEGTDAIFVYVGENVSWKSAVTVTDNSGTYYLSVDNSKVNLDAEGIYSVTYTATDGSGNATTLTVKVVVNKKMYSYDTLMGTISTLSANIGITSSMNKEQQVRKVYEYVNDATNIEYLKTGSNIPNIDRDNWETDWVEEAVRTLAKHGGDCYSYYSVAKAFFEYLGIEHVGIQRDNTNIPAKEGTHFWLMVNIGTASNAKWYYFDATRLAGTFSDGTSNGCLMTLKKIQSYSPSGSLGYDFYEFDPTKYPTASTATLS